jgi:hypothetical protein
VLQLAERDPSFARDLSHGCPAPALLVDDLPHGLGDGFPPLVVVHLFGHGVAFQYT